VRIRLNDFGRTVPKGHRLRLAIQNQFWFVLWPQPTLSTFTLTSGTSTVRLPVRPPSPLDRRVAFAPPEVSAPVPMQTIRDGFHRKSVEDDLGSGVRTIRLTSDFGETLLSDRNITVGSRGDDVFTIHPDDPLTAKLVSQYAWTMRSGPADVSGMSQTELTADATHYHLTWSVTASEAGREVFRRSRTIMIAREP
jgi:hypothetical protein